MKGVVKKKENARDGWPGLEFVMGGKSEGGEVMGVGD